jgi:predicted transcriptional regulator
MMVDDKRRQVMETTIGNAELRLLRFIEERGPLTVRAAHEGYGEPLGLVRTTVQQMMERMRKKGLLTRSVGEGGWLYSPTTMSTNMAQNAIHQFVTQALGGSIAPLVSYLAEQTDLSPAQREELQRLLESLDD